MSNDREASHLGRTALNLQARRHLIPSGLSDDDKQQLRVQAAYETYLYMGLQFAWRPRRARA